MKFTTQPELSGSFGVVSSTHWLASAVEMSMLERKGNARAVVAAGFTLQVIEPHQNGPGVAGHRGLPPDRGGSRAAEVCAGAVATIV